MNNIIGPVQVERYFKNKRKPFRINWLKVVSYLGGSIPIVTAVVVAILGRG